MKNTEYWDSFYKKGFLEKTETAFAQFVAKRILSKKGAIGKIIDVACGNGRDSVFFKNLGLDTYAVDKFSNVPELGASFIKADLFDIDYAEYDYIYLRFVVHTLTEAEFDRLLELFAGVDKYLIIYIETRSTKNIVEGEKAETNFKSSVGEKHFRMLYSYDYIKNKLDKNCTILQIEEKKDCAIYKDENPYVIRAVFSNKLKPIAVQQINKRNLLQVVAALDKEKINYCPAYGTMLGLSRDGDIIEGDDDIDFWVPAEEFDSAIAAMQSAGYCVYERWYKTNIFTQFRGAIDGVQVLCDIYFYNNASDKFIADKWNFWGQHQLPEASLFLPKELMFPLQKITYEGVEISFPRYPENLCEYIYGKRYKEKMPKSKYKVTFQDNIPVVIYLD